MWAIKILSWIDKVDDEGDGAPATATGMHYTDMHLNLQGGDCMCAIVSKDD